MESTQSSNVPQLKDELRRKIIAARRARPIGRRQQDAARLAAIGLAGLPAPARVVAAYAAFGTEPDTRPLIEAVRGRGLRVLLPVLLPDGDLDWAAYEGWEGLRPGLRGLLEPTGPRLGVSAVRGVDVMLVPALAVDRAGRRLGRGGGSFDRALVRVQPGHALAVVYDDEVLDEVPAEPHDQRVGGALTPSMMLRFAT